MILYHGSNMEIDEILLSKGRHGKDFGRGFYLSADYMQAVRMSENVVRREGIGTPFVTKFEDAVGVQIRQLSRGFITFDKFLESIKYTKPTIQYFFGTERAIKLLEKI